MEITVRNGKCYLRDICLEDVARKFGTPFYLYDLSDIYEKSETIRDHFGEYIKLYYAIKANSNLELLKAMREKVDGLDISSCGEMEQSLLAGYSPQQLSFAGPGKTFEELEQAIRNKIGIISVESIREMEAVAKISRELNQKAHIALRVNPTLLIKEFAIKMGGQATQFGIDEEKIDEAIKCVRQNEDYLNCKGIHVYSGTQCMSEEAILRNVGNVLRIAIETEEKYGLRCTWINLGGGFGVSYHDDQKLNIDTIAEGVKKAIEDYKQLTKGKPTFIFELGRYLVTEAGIYVAKVVSHKESRGKLYFVLDGGMNHHLAASGNFGQVIRKNFLVKNLSNPEGKVGTCNLVGPLCTTLDILGRDIRVESPRLGDIIAFLNSGSYGFTSSPLLFLGHETPLEVLACDNQVRLIRNRKKLNDFN